MRFTPGALDGLYVIEIEPIEDHRGFFARFWCEDEFEAHDLVADWPQGNLQFSPDAGTMRGLHYQLPPHSETKLVRCTRGSVYDVAVDLRPDSPTFLQWSGVELRADQHTSVWTPEGCAHGYVTLERNTEVFYLTSNIYVPEAVRGIRYDDPAFAITWPRSVDILPADYDHWPFFSEADAYFWPSSDRVRNK